MARVVLLATVGLLGCGRIGIDAIPSEAGVLGDALRDAPTDGRAVPTAICKVDHIAFSLPPTLAQLAIAGISEGYAAIWIDPSGGKATQGLVLGPNHTQLGAPVLPVIRGTQVGGLADAGQKLALATSDGTTQSTWVLGRDLTTVEPSSTLTGSVLAHDPFPTDDSQQPRLFLAGAGTSVTAALLASDGTINTASTVSHATTGPVTGVACANGPNHAHCAWTEDLPDTNGASRCTASDVIMRPLGIPPSGSALSDDCHDVRTSSGPSAADSVFVVWTTSDHRVQGRYLSAATAPVVDLAAAGSAPRVQFDGTRFWIAWLDGNAKLRLTSYDLDGTVVPYLLTDWVPRGPAAFQLVRRSNETVLALISAFGLELLTICS